MGLTIQQAIDKIIAKVPGAPFPETVDVVKTGDANQELKGIAVTFLANRQVIEQALAAGANLIITHEPTFYNHLDKTAWLDGDPVYNAKRKLLDSSGVVIWRFHDYLHSIPPDNTVMGLAEVLDWQPPDVGADSFVCEIEPLSLGELGKYVKQKLDVPFVRVVGNLDSRCTRVAIIPGSPPVEFQAAALRDADALIAGEINEWEMNEYARDATLAGLTKGLVVIGHAASEEPGMRRIVPWLRELLPNVPIEFIATRNPFNLL